MPGGKFRIPGANDVPRLPFASNLRIAGRFEPVHEFCWQRSATQMLTPSRSISTALVEPQVRPSGSLAQPVIVSYGFGRSLVGGIDALPPACAAAWPARTAVKETAVTE